MAANVHLLEVTYEGRSVFVPLSFFFSNSLLSRQFLFHVKHFELLLL